MKRHDRLYTFGDSFSVFDENWIKGIREELGLDVHTRSVGGSGIFWAIYSLEKANSQGLIQENDRIILTIANPCREYFDGTHVMGPDLDQFSFNGTGILHKVKMEAIKQYWMYLDNGYNTTQERSWQIAYLINTLIPSLPTKKVALFFTIESGIQDHPLVDFDFQRVPFLDLTIAGWYKEKYGFDRDRAVEEYMSTPNHWPPGEEDSLEFSKYFFYVYGKYIYECLR